MRKGDRLFFIHYYGSKIFLVILSFDCSTQIIYTPEVRCPTGTASPEANIRSKTFAPVWE